MTPHEIKRRFEHLEAEVRALREATRVPLPGEVVRASAVPRHWPVLSAGTWKKWIADGTLRSHTVGGTRARFVLVDHVIELLRDSRTDGH